MKVWLFLLAALVFTPPASAGCADGCPGRQTPEVATSWSGDSEAPARIILATPSHGYGGPIWAALEIDVADGWVIYAASASDGAAPELQWGGSVNLAPVARRWPAPEHVMLEGKKTAVFRRHVVLPLSIAPVEPGEDIQLQLTLSYAVCGEVCRPASSVHRIRIHAAPVTVPEVAERYARMIAEALSRAAPD